MILSNYYYHIVTLYSFALVGSELVDSGYESRVSGQVLNTVDAEKQVFKSIYGDLNRFIADSLTVLAPISTAVENDLCRNHSLLFHDAVINNKMWALRMLDASSKLPSGLLEGNVVHLGNYDQCLAVQDVESEFGSFSGQFCIATIGKRSYVTEMDLMEKRRIGFELTSDDLSAEGVEQLLSRMSMLWSVCVPSSCQPRDVQQHLRTAMRTRLGNVSISVQDGACSSRASRKPLRTRDWGFIVFLSVIGVLAVLSTWHDLTTSKSSARKELLLAFSLKLHLQRLLRDGVPSVDDFPVINAVKTITMLGVIFIHFTWFISFYPAINYNYISEFLEQLGWGGTLLVNGHFTVDSFFLVSGLLMCYNFLKDREKGVELSLPHYYLHRVIRIVPLYAVLRVFMATLLTAEGLFVEGPYLGATASGISSRCEEWVYSTMFLVNYQPLLQQCMGHSWYLSADMQLFLLSPLILYPLWRRPMTGKYLVCFLTVLGAAISVGVAYVNKLHVHFVLEAGDLGTLLYYPTHTRFTPWVIGVGVGYVLHATKQLSTPRLAPSTVTFGWIVSITLMITSFFFINYFLRADYQYDRLSSSLYLGLMRPAWALGLGWLVFASSRGYGARSAKIFFSRHIFTVINRLSYSVYLVHMFVLTGFIFHVRTPIYLSGATLVAKFFTQFFVSLACGLICHLLFEAPPIYMERFLFRKAKISQKEQ